MGILLVIYIKFCMLQIFCCQCINNQWIIQTHNNKERKWDAEPCSTQETPAVIGNCDEVARVGQYHWSNNGRDLSSLYDWRNTERTPPTNNDNSSCREVDIKEGWEEEALQFFQNATVILAYIETRRRKPDYGHRLLEDSSSLQSCSVRAALRSCSIVLFTTCTSLTR